MRGVVLAAVVLASSVADAKGKGKPVDLDFSSVAIGDVLRLLADVGRVNVVVLEGADTTIELRAKLVPWDDVLSDAVAKAKLAFVREGNLVIVGSQAAIDARKTAKKGKASGPSVDLDVLGASAKDAAYLVAIASQTPFELDGGNDVTLRLRRASLSVVKDMIALQSAATVAPAPAKRALARAKGACAAQKLTFDELELVGVMTIGTKRWAMLGTKTSAETYVVTPTDCIGVEGVKITRILPDSLEIDGNVVLLMYPRLPVPR